MSWLTVSFRIPANSWITGRPWGRVSKTRHAPLAESFPTDGRASVGKECISHFCAYSALTLFVVLIQFPHVAYLFHYNFGKNSLDAVFTSMQASFGVNEQLKKMCFLLWIQDPLHRAAAAWFTFAAFAVQWVFMLPTFSMAPIPYLHVVAELCFLMDAIVLTREYLHGPSKVNLKDSNHGFQPVASEEQCQYLL